MALSRSAVSELFDALRTGRGVDLIRESARIVVTRHTERVCSSAVFGEVGAVVAAQLVGVMLRPHRRVQRR